MVKHSTINKEMAIGLVNRLLRMIIDKDKIRSKYHNDRKNESLASLPEMLIKIR